ncbi:MAG TPA: hypothetical protein VGB54_08350 [Allosphingosinicella sp.]
MPMNRAGRNYVRRFVPTMSAYVITLLGANWAIAHWQPDGALLILLAILPALPILGVVAVMGLYLAEESDEYLRQRTVLAMLIGTGLLLAVATVWGFLEDDGVVPHVPAYWAFCVWCAGLGIAQVAIALRDRRASPP